MRTAMLCLLALILVAASMNAQTTDQKPFVRATIEQTEQSLTMALNSDIPGLQVSAAATIRELKEMMPERSFSSLIVPLMRVVRNEEGERDARIVAALALHELNSSRGDYVIKTTSIETSNPRVARICSWLARPKNPGMNPELQTTDSSVVAEYFHHK